jgi:hypothetical protein
MHRSLLSGALIVALTGFLSPTLAYNTCKKNAIVDGFVKQMYIHGIMGDDGTIVDDPV